jgi:hypothetical protein
MKTAMTAAALGLALGAASAGAFAEAGGATRPIHAPAAAASIGAAALAQAQPQERADPDRAGTPGTTGWLDAADACLALAAVGALVLLGRRRGFE